MKGERRPLKAKLLEYRKTKKQQESRKEENLQQSNPTSTHQNQASHSARENETPQNLWKRPEPRQEADHLTSFPAARETNIPTDTENDEPLSHQKNVLPLDAPAWRCILENFGFDLLDNYPMRKWRDYCEKSPLRCWFFTGCFWAIGQFIAAKAEFGFVFLITCMLLLIFLNLGIRKEGELSAYSVFNPNYERLLGELTGEDFERELLMRKGIGKSSMSD